MVNLDGISIARSPVFGREAYKILWYLTARLLFDDFTVLNVSEIASDLGLKSQAVSRALRALIEGGVVEPRWGAVLMEPRAKLHLYGKPDPRLGRKMGHFTVQGADVEDTLALARDIRARL